jgi:hypothetical protein
MRVRDYISRSQPPAAAHVVQFFDSDETRHQAAAAFLEEGYLSGCPLLLIARPLNTTAIVDRLEQSGVPIRDAARSGRVKMLDAAKTLRRISRMGSPEARLFDDVVGTLVKRVSRLGRVYAYGEMVDIVAQRGDFADATVLEDLWNRLIGKTPISLRCGYAAAHFVSAATHDALRHICAAHGGVRVEPQDALAVWLLAQAQ